MEKVLDRILKTPLGAKIAVTAGIVAVVTVVNYFAMGVNLGPSVSEMDGPKAAPTTR